MKKISSLIVFLVVSVATFAQNPFIKEVSYRGAFAPAPTTPWTDGWTKWDPQNTDYGTPTVNVSAAITTNTTWISSNVYLLQGLIYVKNGATLTIEPGTKILGAAGTNASLIITKGSKINAVGTSSNPIVFSSSKPAGERAVGDWGGVIILGKGTLNRPGGTANIEGIANSDDTQYGGGASPDNEDNSGNLKYVRIEYGGYVFNTDQEINGLTLGAVGRNTVIDYVQCSFINDDAFEWFGGTVNAAHLVAYRCLDDDFDTDFGYSGSVQFALSVRDPQLSDQSGASATSEGFESDNDGTGSSNTPQTSCLFSNVTVVGPFRGTTLSSWPSTFKFRRGARLRRNSGIKILNSILMDFPYGVFIDGAAVRNNLQTGVTVFKDNIIAGSTLATEPGTAASVVDSLFNQARFANDSIVSTTGLLVNPYDFTSPDYRPAVSSPALSGVNFTDAAFNNRKIVITSASFIKEVTFRGAFAPSPSTMWTDGWTNWDPGNTVYPTPTVTVSGIITSNTTWTASNTYSLNGLVYVAAGVTLTIEPGTVIRSGTGSALIITRNAKIIAEGTLANPIVFTSIQGVGARNVGDWGGLIVLGRASLNRPGGVANIEGIAANTNTEYGGGAAPNDDDNSGILKYVRIEYGGYVFATDQEINGLTFGSVGRGTSVDFIQVSYTNDDAFEWFGGTVNCAHLVAYRNLDDNWDTDFGYSGSVQFALGVRDPSLSDQSGASATSEGFESDNDGTGSSNTPQTRALFSNVTEIGPFRGNKLSSWPGTFKFRRAARIRRNSGMRLFNSILTDYPYGVFIDGSAVRNNLQTGITKFKNNLIAGCFLSTEPGTAVAVRDSIFGSGTGLFKNDSLTTTDNVLVNPYDYLTPDYRPGSQPLASTGASFGDEVFSGLIAPCDEVSAPGSITGPSNLYLCDTSISHTYNVPVINNASSYIWTLPTGARFISGQGTRTIVVKFASTYIAGGVISVVGKNDCGNNSVASTLTIVKVKPGTPASVSGLANNCSAVGGTTTYSTAAVANAESYTWAVPAVGASIISGQGTNSVVVAFTGDYTTGSISVKANSTCFTAGTLKTLTVTKKLPSTPGAITGATDVCPSFSSPSADSSNTVTYRINRVLIATSYEWTAPTGAKIISGQGDTAVTIKFVRTFVSGAVSVRAVSPCGNSALRTLTVFRRVANLPGAIQKSFVPSVAAQLAVCGKTSETYTIRRVTYATAYAWTLKNGTNASITSVNGAGPSDTVVTVTFSPGFTTDSLIVRAVTACSESAPRRIFLSALSLTPAVTSIVSSTDNFAPCAGNTVTYTAFASLPTVVQSPIEKFRWTRPNGTAVVSANTDSSEITISYLSTYKGGALAARGQSACNILGSPKSVTLQYLPPTPVSISSSTGNFAPCKGDAVTYSVNVNPPSIVQTSAVRYRWTTPKNVTITGASGTDSTSITVLFGSLYTGGSISAKGETACGVFGGVRSAALTLCPPPAARSASDNTITSSTEVADQLYPNPNNGKFRLTVNTGITERANVVVRLFDMTGKVVAQFNAINMGGVINSTYDAGQLPNGVYNVQYILGDQSRSIKMFIQK